MKIREMQMDPESAKKILELNTHNRPLRQGHVDFLMSEIINGNWKLLHQPVAIGTNNVLLDGQHRLYAIFLSGKTVPIMVATEVDPTSYIAIDRGATRSVSDVLHANRLVIEVVSLICTIAIANQGGKISPSYINGFLPFFGKQSETLLSDGTGSAKPRVSAAPIRTAAVLRMVNMPLDTGRICAAYRNLVHRDYEKLSKTMTAFLRQLDESPLVGKDRHALLVRAWVAFDPDKQSMSKLLIRDQNEYVDEIKALVYRTTGAKVAARKIKKSVTVKEMRNAVMAT